MEVWLHCYLLVTIFLAGYNHAQTNITETKVLVLGAGMSGIMAAKTLHDNGIANFIILEGSNRVGGRTRDAEFQGYKVELGTQWIHGASIDNPIYYEASRRNISFQLTDFDNWAVRNDSGQDVTDEADAVYDRFYETVEEFELYREKMVDEGRPDMNLRSAWEYFGWEPFTPLEYLCDWYEADFEFARPPEECSAKYIFSETYTDFTDDNTLVINEGGYGELHKSLLADFISENDSTKRLRLNTIVQSIQYNDEGVTVTTNNGDIYQAEYAIVTFSIGVLQNNDVTFIPQMPEWKQESIHGFQMGHFMHFMMKFQYQFWDDTEFIAHPCSLPDYFPVFANFNKYRPGSNLLQATVTGGEALRLQALSDDDIINEVMVVLRKMYNSSIPDPIDNVIRRWSTDPLFMGSFVSWPSGFSLESHKAMCAPLGRLYFAGEACKMEYFGFLHGAYLSGVETAEQLVDCIEDDKCPDPFVPSYAAQGCTYRKAKNYDKNAQVDDGSCVFRKWNC